MNRKVSKDDTDLVTVERAAKWLGVSETWVRRAASERRIESVRVGSLLRFSPEAIQDYIDEHTRELVGA